MGAGFTEVRNYHMKQGYYKGRDKDPKNGKSFWSVIEPFHGWDGERFFYVKKLENGKFHFEGEGYAFYQPADLKPHLKDLQKELQGVLIHYFFINDEGQVTKTEVEKEPISYSA